MARNGDPVGIARRCGRARVPGAGMSGVPPRVSIVMPVHNRARLLDLVLGKLAENTTHPDVELIAVDDHSTDGSPELLRRWAEDGRGPRMRVIESPGRGAIDALNAG